MLQNAGNCEKTRCPPSVNTQNNRTNTNHSKLFVWAPYEGRKHTRAAFVPNHHKSTVNHSKTSQELGKKHDFPQNSHCWSFHIISGHQQALYSWNKPTTCHWCASCSKSPLTVDCSLNGAENERNPHPNNGIKSRFPIKITLLQIVHFPGVPPSFIGVESTRTVRLMCKLVEKNNSPMWISLKSQQKGKTTDERI